LTIYFYL